MGRKQKKEKEGRRERERERELVLIFGARLLLKLDRVKAIKLINDKLAGKTSLLKD